MKTTKQNSQNNLIEEKLYGPKYFSSLILVAFVLFFYILLRIIKHDIFFGEFIIYLLMFVLVVCVELIGFARAVQFGDESMMFWNGFQYIFHFKPKKIKYSEIIKINEMDTPRKKFANLKIITKKKIYMISVTGISDYEGMKRELETYI